MACMVARSGRELQRYDNMGRRQVVGCIPYRFKNCSDGFNGDELEVLVITSQKGQAQGMMFPKVITQKIRKWLRILPLMYIKSLKLHVYQGGWELDESVEEAASRESLEEAGVLGNVEDELGKWNFLSKRHGTFYKGFMFPLFVTKQLDLWPEKSVRQRIWMTVDEAREVCRHWWMKEALDILVERHSSLQQLQKELALSCSLS
uniref:Nudix hydrolase domain-containing protein n=1 Tax=Populus davidiana TaxID=266767 RepID=A0A6M2FC96_9ROSI